MRCMRPALPLLQHAEGTQGKVLPCQPPTARRPCHPARHTSAAHSPALPRCSSQAGHQLTPSTGPQARDNRNTGYAAVRCPGVGSWCMLGCPFCSSYSLQVLLLFFGSKGTERDRLATPLQVRGAGDNRYRAGGALGCRHGHEPGRAWVSLTCSSQLPCVPNLLPRMGGLGKNLGAPLLKELWTAPPLRRPVAREAWQGGGVAGCEDGRPPSVWGRWGLAPISFFS